METGRGPGERRRARRATDRAGQGGGRGGPAPGRRAELARRLRRIQIASRRLVDNLLAGGYRSVFRGQGIEFDEVRDYSPGDDVRLIDWNVTSRMGSPYTKTFREERELSLFIVADVSASMAGGSGESGRDETALLAFATLALSAAANNDRVGAVLYSDRIEKWVAPGKGGKHIHRLLNDYAMSTATSRGSDLALALRTVGQSLKRRGICVILSDFRTEGYWQELALLARRHDVIAVRIIDPVDAAFPEIGLVTLEDPETGDTLQVAGTAALRRGYEQFATESRGEWRRRCQRCGVETLEIGTGEDPGLALARFFERRRRRR
jgi:uncharacterized protein (DUF58 family)